MKLKLPSGEQLKLPNLKHYKNRIQYLEKDVINNNAKTIKLISTNQQGEHITTTLENYFNFSDHKTWIGSMISQKSNASDDLKISLDVMSSYILIRNEFTVNKDIREYKKFIDKVKSESLMDDELTKLVKIKDNVIYYNKLNENVEIIFYINKKYERFLDNRLRELNRQERKLKIEHKTCKSEVEKNGISRELDELSKIKKRLSENKIRISLLKENATKYKNRIYEISDSIKYIKADLKVLYNKFTSEKLDDIYNEITYKVEELRKLNNEYLISENRIRDSYSEYEELTTLFVNYN